MSEGPSRRKTQAIAPPSLDFTEGARQKLSGEKDRGFLEFANSLPECVFETDEEGYFTFANRRSSQYFGYSRDDLAKGLRVIDVVAPDERDRAWQMFQGALRGEVFGGVSYTALRKDGTTFPAMIHATPITDGSRPAGLRGIVVDVSEQVRAEDELRRTHEELERRVEERTAELSRTVRALEAEVIERIQTEKALRDSEERLKILFESAPDACYLNDLQGNFVDGNATSEEISGYKREELIGKSFLSLQLLDPDQVPKAATLLARNASGQATGPDEIILNRKDGTQVPLEIRTFPVTIKGQPLVLGIARDITKRRLAEETLRQSEARSRALLQAIPDMMFRMNSDGVYLDFQPAAGLEPLVPPGQFLGRTVLDVLPPELAREVMACIGRVLSTGDVQTMDYRLPMGDDLRDFEARVVVSGKDEVTAIVRDVTDRMRAEEALRDSEERYRQLVELSPYGTAVHSEEQIQFVNSAGAELLGSANPDDLIGRPIWEIIPPRERPAVKAQLRKAGKREERVRLTEEKALRLDGRVIDVEMAAIPVVYHGKAARQVVFRDISDRKRAQIALQKAREALDARVERQMGTRHVYGLTFRELTVLNLVAAGRTDREMATILGISYLTARKHLANVLGKMGATSRTEAGVRALREGLID